MWLGTIAQLSDASGTAISTKGVPVQAGAPIGTTVLLAVETNALSTADGNFAATDNATGGGAANVWTEVAHRFKSGTTQISLLACTLTRALTTSNTITLTHALSGTAVTVAFWCVSAEAFDDLAGFDVMAVNDGSSASATSGPTAAGAQANELAFVVTASGGTGVTLTQQAGWAASPQVDAAGASVRHLLASWKYLTSGGTRSGSTGLSASATWAQIVAVFKSAAPPQVLVPNGDVTTTNWVQTGGTAGSFFTNVDEGTTPDITDFDTSQANPVSQVLEFNLAPGSVPSDLTGHKLAAYMRLNGSAGTALLRLKQGTTTIATSGTITLTPGVWGWYTFTLNSTQAGTITDYTTLRAHIEVTATP